MFGSSLVFYLLDFYHVSKYLYAASNETTTLGQEWFKEQEKRLLEGDSESVLKSLRRHFEGESLKVSKALVRKAYRYLSSRKDQLDYPEAKAEDLHLGSGMIEGGHHHILQNRLKKSGAWWKQNNFYTMVYLRVARANKEEDQCWKDLRKAA